LTNSLYTLLAGLLFIIAGFFVADMCA